MTATTKKLSTPAGPVSARLELVRDSSTVFVLAHGAGGDMNSTFMEEAASGLATAGISVVRFNFVYSENGKRAPDRQPVLEATFAAVLDGLAAETDGKRLILSGKSMGGRIASHLVADGHPADGLVFFGYPLHPPGRPDRIRDEHLSRVKSPMLFIEGTRDPFCPLETLDSVIAERKLEATVHVIEDGDHSFKVRKASGRSTPEAWAEVVAVASDWALALDD